MKPMQGLHLVADLGGVAASLPEMTDPEALRRLCLSAVAQSGLGAVAELFHRFTPAADAGQSGITGVVLLAESHLAIHTWPELASVTLDVYACNLGRDNSARAEALLQQLVQAFAPQEQQCQRLQRGRPSVL
ncbi:adenosylmethionine decarboxylase [Roseateles sp. BYS180W]|uniref:Adenosylmethionine decarboxylase n=1 Tax=Roseateles rivi TaxID=3299028 RepID=A0ABW7FSN0_9BURK